MTILPIVKLDNPILRKKAHRVTDFGPELQTLIDNMIETMMDAPGVGLAAPQVNVPLRLIVVRLPDDEESREEYGDQAGQTYAVANPEILKRSRARVEGVEACLSLPGYFGKVDRHETIIVTGQDREGKPFRIKAKDWQARVFQHEIDHLNGQLYIDIASDVWEEKENPSEKETAE